MKAGQGPEEGVSLYTSSTIIGASLSEPHINGTSMRAVFICIIYYYGTTIIHAPLHILSTKAACNVFGCKVCVVKTTATFCSNIAHNIIGLFAIFPSWLAI